MNLQEFVQNFADQLEETDASEVTPKTRFRDLKEWDSTFVMAIIAMTKLKYGKNFTGLEIKDCNTIEDMFNFIASK